MTGVFWAETRKKEKNAPINNIECNENFIDL
jgi:hypothetical protein